VLESAVRSSVLYLSTVSSITYRWRRCSWFRGKA